MLATEGDSWLLTCFQAHADFRMVKAGVSSRGTAGVVMQFWGGSMAVRQRIWPPGVSR